MKTRTSVYAFIASAFIVAFSAVPSVAGTVTIAGDPCSIPLITKLAEAYSAKHRDFKAEVSTFACTLGIYKAAAGEFSAGVSTQNGLDENRPKGSVNAVIARSPIVLIVHSSNPVTNLTYQQVAGIFSGKITNWKEVGGADLEIKNVMLEPCVRHTMSKQVVLYGESINQLLPGKKGNPVDSTNRLVEENEGAIGQQIYGYESKDVKVITVDGLLPDETNTPAKYTFFQDYNILTKGEPSEEVKGFIEFAYSAEGADIIKSMRHIPVKR